MLDVIELLPVGNYEGRITEAETGTGKSTGRPFVKCTLKLVTPEFRGIRVYTFTALPTNDTSMDIWEQILHFPDVSTLTQQHQPISELVGRYYTVKIRHRVGPSDTLYADASLVRYLKDQ